MHRLIVQLRRTRRRATPGRLHGKRTLPTARILVRKRCGIDQVIICTGNRHAFLLHIVQPHETIVMFRVTLCNLINTELLFAAIQQHIFLFCHVPLLLQICYCNLEGITSALDFLSCRDKNRPRTDADKINLLTLVIQPQSLFTVYHCQQKIRARIQIAATIYTQARLRTSLFCFLLYQLSLWWVKYRAQPEAIST